MPTCHDDRPLRTFKTLILSAAMAMAATSRAFAGDAAASTGDAALALEVEHATTRILSIEGDRAYGEYLGGECVTCHQQSGDASGIPPIRGLPAEYTVQALLEYKLGVRNNDVMKLMTGRLSDEEIAALAVYFADMD